MSYQSIYGQNSFENHGQLVLAIHQANTEIEQLRRENKKLAEQNANQRDQIAELASDLYFVQTVLGNGSLNGNQCRVLNAIHEIEKVAKPREDGLYKMYRASIAQRAGISLRTVTNAVKSLADNGILHREIECHGGGSDLVTKELYIAIPQPILQNPQAIVLAQSDEQSWGGARVKTCRSCGSSELEEIHRYICRDCGQVHEQNETIDVLESTLDAEESYDTYPMPQLEALAIDGINSPNRNCLRCGSRDWLPAYDEGRWIILCGSDTCHPHLMESQGLDLSKGIAYREE